MQQIDGRLGIHGTCSGNFQSSLKFRHVLCGDNVFLVLQTNEVSHHEVLESPQAVREEMLVVGVLEEDVPHVPLHKVIKIHGVSLVHPRPLAPSQCRLVRHIMRAPQLASDMHRPRSEI